MINYYRLIRSFVKKLRLDKYHQEGLIDRNSLETRDSEHLLNRELPSLNHNFNETGIFENLAKVMDKAS